jgi:hypothetical protein
MGDAGNPEFKCVMQDVAERVREVAKVHCLDLVVADSLIMRRNPCNEDVGGLTAGFSDHVNMRCAAQLNMVDMRHQVTFHCFVD